MARRAGGAALQSAGVDVGVANGGVGVVVVASVASGVGVGVVQLSQNARLSPPQPAPYISDIAATASNNLHERILAI